MKITLTLTADEKHACRRAAVHVRGIAAGFADATGKDAAACARYAETLEDIARCEGTCSFDEEAKIDIEQASFLLEGICGGLETAELDTAADAVQRDIERLNDLAQRFNSIAATVVEKRQP